MLGHKTILNKFKKKIITGIFSDHNGMKLEVNYKKKKEKRKKPHKNNMVLNNKWIIKEIK